MEAPTYISRNRLEELPVIERHRALQTLEEQLTQRLKDCAEWDGYWIQVREIIDDLRLEGHDLWDHDFDGQSRQLWGWNYENPDTAGFLQILFQHKGPVRTFWRTENPRVATNDTTPILSARTVEPTPPRKKVPGRPPLLPLIALAIPAVAWIAWTFYQS